VIEVSDTREVGKADAADLLAQARSVFVFFSQSLKEVNLGRGITP
jgi:hypothetical protein